MSMQKIFIALLAFLMPEWAFAHASGSHAFGFIAGLKHMIAEHGLLFYLLAVVVVVAVVQLFKGGKIGGKTKH